MQDIAGTNSVSDTSPRLVIPPAPDPSLANQSFSEAPNTEEALQEISIKYPLLDEEEI